jgi:hypothetical protein
MTHSHDMQHGGTHPGHQPADQDTATKDVATFHGMVLFGEETAYLSHLPMFMFSHDYQAIFEVTLSREGTDPLAFYTQDRRENPPGSPERPDPESKMYAFAPKTKDPFILTDLITSANPHDAQSPPLRSSFRGVILRGHFDPDHHHEKNGPVILDDVTAHVTNAVLFRKFDPHAQEPPQLEYFLFGKARELFLAHVITGPPDFDQILNVQVDGHQFTDDELRQGLLVTFPGREDTADQRIQEQEQVTGQVQVPAQRPDGPRSLAVRLKAGTQYYFDMDDLA